MIARDGLTSAEAAARLHRDGPTRRPTPKRPSPARRFVAGLVHFFALMLWVAGGLAFLADLPELGVAIFAVVVINAVFSFVKGPFQFAVLSIRNRTFATPLPVPGGRENKSMSSACSGRCSKNIAATRMRVNFLRIMTCSLCNSAA